MQVLRLNGMAMTAFYASSIAAEITVATKTSHQCLARAVCAGIDEATATAFIVMPFLPLGSVGAVLRGRRARGCRHLPIDTVLTLWLQVTKGLRFLHDKLGVMHRCAYVVILLAAVHSARRNFVIPVKKRSVCVCRCVCVLVFFWASSRSFRTWTSCQITWTQGIVAFCACT